MFSTTVSAASRLYDWKMNPIRVARISASLSSLIFETSTSLRRNRPPAGPAAEAAEQIQERALAGPGGAHDRDVVAGRHVERHAAERMDRLAAEHVVLAEITDLDGRSHPPAPPSVAPARD